MTLDRGLRTSFDKVARLYDEARPGYPEPLIEEVLLLSGIPIGGSILEVGCGTGQATLPFARRGYAMLCLELGKELAALAAKHCRPYPGVEVQNVSFEEWPLRRKAFDLVISAQAFDWIPPELGYPKSAAALKDTGSLALFWHHSPGTDTPFRRSVERVYQQRAPHLVKHLPGKKPSDPWVRKTVEDIESSGLFRPAVVKRYPWSEEYTTERYIKLLRTYSLIRALDEDVRRDLLVGIREVIEQFGGRVESREIAVLCVARVLR